MPVISTAMAALRSASASCTCWMMSAVWSAMRAFWSDSSPDCASISAFWRKSSAVPARAAIAAISPVSEATTHRRVAIQP